MIPKIAIKGHPNRGKEVIKILESLGGKNDIPLRGDSIKSYYYIDHNDNNRIYCHSITYVNKYCKKYTLEEFKEEFPFKIGDKVKHISSICIIRKYCYMNNKPCYEVESIELGIVATIPVKLLEPYKEMKEERNITLSLEKAKEYYEKGGELKELALQAFNEEELNEIKLPKNWKEFCKNYSIKKEETYIDTGSNIRICESGNERDVMINRNICPSKKSAEAHLALIQLEQLRDCYRQGDIPNFNNPTNKYCIIKQMNDINIIVTCYSNRFLSFTKRKVAEEFLTNFKPLIKIAEDYI